MTRSGLRLQVLVSVALIGAACCAAQAQVSVAGGDDIVWIFRSSSGGEDGQVNLQFVYALASQKPVQYLPLPVVQTMGRIVRAAARGQNLHVFFEDGTHYRFRPPPTLSYEGHNDFPELKLPESCVPIALAGDDAANALLGVVPTRIAEALSRPATSEPAEEAESQPAPTTEAASQPTPATREAASRPLSSSSQATSEPAPPSDPEPAEYTLVQYVRGEWSAVGPIPFLPHEPLLCLLSAHESRYHLYFADEASGDVVWHSAYYGHAWTTPQRVPDLSPAQCLHAYDDGKTVGLIVSQANPPSRATGYQIVVYDNDAWTHSEPLMLPASSDQQIEETADVGRFTNQVAVAMLADGDPQKPRTVYVGLWAPKGGEPTSAPRLIPSLSPQVVPIASQRARMLVAILIFTAMLAIVFMRRREGFLTDFPTPPGFVLASLGRRFYAFVIDLVIVAFIAVPVTLWSWFAQHIDFQQPLGTQLAFAMVQYQDELYWRWLAAAGIYVVYAIVFEAIFAATPGKLVLHMRVCNDHAERCSFWAIIVRNALRFELYPMFEFAPTLILVVLTRNRQRLGDLVARTIVVERARTIPTPPDDMTGARPT